jgi:hypothetical protein
MEAGNNNHADDWFDDAKKGSERPTGDAIGIERKEGVEVEPPAQTPRPEKPSMSQPQPEKIPPGGGTKRGM